mgnify:CR=1 FL=1
MDIFDNESEIIALFQSIRQNETMLFPSEDDEAKKLFESIVDLDLWKAWTDSSAHDAPPPDFYNEEMRVMMDIMRVDDHGHKNKKGKIVNPARQHDTELIHELESSGILKQFSNAKLIVNGITDLPTHKDHNYSYYYKNFCRTVNSHKEKIANYKKNHPGFSVVFFVFDESSMYCSTLESYQNRRVGDLMKAFPHLWFTDKRFIDVLIDSEIDYLIWFTPYKYANTFIENGERLILPCAVVINVHYIDKIPLNDYPLNTMESTEL